MGAQVRSHEHVARHENPSRQRQRRRVQRHEIHRLGPQPRLKPAEQPQARSGRFFFLNRSRGSLLLSARPPIPTAFFSRLLRCGSPQAAIGISKDDCFRSPPGRPVCSGISGRCRDIGSTALRDVMVESNLEGRLDLRQETIRSCPGLRAIVLPTARDSSVATVGSVMKYRKLAREPIVAVRFLRAAVVLARHACRSKDLRDTLMTTVP